MNRYYLYIQTGVQLNTDSKFYKVACGESAAGNRMNAWLEAYAAEHGHYFVRWSHDAADFYTKCVDSIGPDAHCIVAIGAKELIQSLKTGCDDPACWQAIQHRHNLLMQIDPHYYVYHELARRK